MENEVNEVVEQVEEKSSHHHHHHHRHHHHHHHKSKSKKKSKFSLRRFVKKYKTPLRIGALILAFAITITATTLIVQQIDRLRAAGEVTPPDAQPTPPAAQLAADHVALSVTRFDGGVDLGGEAVTTYLNTSVSVSPEKVLAAYRKDGERLDQGVPVTLSYAALGLADGCNVTGFRVEVTEKGQKAPVFTKDCTAGEDSVQIYNLKTGTTYAYSIRADFTTMDSITVSGSFETAAGPRLLKVDGIGNVRDFGGWKVGNTTIKQGLLIRGSELDGVVEENFLLKEAGKATLQNDLGIRMEIDLRQTSERSSTDRLDDVVYCPDPYNMPFFDGVFDSDKTDAVCRVFKDLSNPDNYPIYMHCTFGRDRTGTVCLILGAVLGMKEEDLLREYGLSALYYGDADYASAYAVLDGLKTYEGETLADKAASYLISIGLDKDEIKSLREIYLR